MSNHRDWKLECKVYVGDLGNHTEKEDLERLFESYGVLRNVFVARNPPGFAFIEFDRKEDAEDAVAELDGTRFNGRNISVEFSTGRSRDRPRGGRRGGYGGYGGGGGRRSYGRDRRYSDDRSRRSRSRSPRRDRRYSRSRSRSP